MMEALGEYTATCRYGNKTHTLNFKVLCGDQRPLLSGVTYETLGMIKIDHNTGIRFD